MEILQFLGEVAFEILGEYLIAGIWWVIVQLFRGLFWMVSQPVRVLVVLISALGRGAKCRRGLANIPDGDLLRCSRERVPSARGHSLGHVPWVAAYAVHLLDQKGSTIMCSRRASSGPKFDPMCIALKIVLAPLFLCFVLSGCGGGVGSNNATGMVNTSVAVDWPLRTRVVSGPSSALSVSFIFHDPAGRQADLPFVADRSDVLAEHNENYVPTSKIHAGLWVLSGIFYAGISETGTAVATFSANVSVQSDGTVTKPNGTALGAIQFNGIIKSVAIAAGQSVTVGNHVQVAASALDSVGTPVPITPGSFNFAVVPGGSTVSVTPDGITLGLSPGNATLTATVDGLTSAEATVTVPVPVIVDFLNPGFETPILAAHTWEEPPDASVIWEGPVAGGFGIANGSGSWGSVSHSGNQYGFLQRADTAGVHQGSCQQTITGMSVGQKYQVSFWMARRNGNVGGNSPAPVSLMANGATVFSATAPPNDTSWHAFNSSVFTATSSSYTFKFQTSPPVPGVDTSSLLDDIHLSLVP